MYLNYCESDYSSTIKREFIIYVHDKKKKKKKLCWFLTNK